MYLFINLDTLLYTDIENRNILFNEKTLLWLNNHKFLFDKTISKIWIIYNNAQIGSIINEKILDIKISYIIAILKTFLKIEIFSYYCPYNQSDDILINSIIKEYNLNEENCSYIGAFDLKNSKIQHICKGF